MQKFSFILLIFITQVCMAFGSLKQQLSLEVFLTGTIMGGAGYSVNIDNHKIGTLLYYGYDKGVAFFPELRYTFTFPLDWFIKPQCTLSYGILIVKPESEENYLMNHFISTLFGLLWKNDNHSIFLDFRFSALPLNSWKIAFTGINFGYGFIF